ncbi:MAG: LysM peptidoglycan-binding domain-containing protein [Gammaproteobacteria bacterium]|nr:LysM peptidoglycan-binding domain-containing protein [Gammaproteobacteria bacterium]
MKVTDLLKVTAVAVFTAGFAVGCSTGSEQTAPVVDEAKCEGPTAEVKNAIYAAKLRNARARNLGYEWRDTAKIIKEAEKAAENCENDRAKSLANKAEAQAADAIAQYEAEKAAMSDSAAEAPPPAPESKYIGGYLVVSGDNLWNIAGQDSIYGNPYQWPLIYKANSDQIRDADLIYPGQYFNIPKAMGAESAAAIEHAKTRGAWTVGETEATDMQYLSQ